MENKEVKIVRFKDGLDVVCFFDTTDDNFELGNPMLFEVRNNNLQMMQWIPSGVVSDTSVIIGKDNILCTFEPTADFKEYFITVIEKLTSFDDKGKKSKKKDDIKEVLDALSELENLKNIMIH